MRPSVALCESDEQYVPLNDGFNWKGDPNATLSGQAIPQLPPDAAASQPQGHPPHPRWRSPNTTRPPAVMWGPTATTTPSRTWRKRAPEDKTWQTMLLPPAE